jgi:hypothetical protein
LIENIIKSDRIITFGKLFADDVYDTVIFLDAYPTMEFIIA